MSLRTLCALLMVAALAASPAAAQTGDAHAPAQSAPDTPEGRAASTEDKKSPQQHLDEGEKGMQTGEGQAPGAHTEKDGGHGAADPHAVFKESPSVKAVAKFTGLSLGAAYWASIIFNFLIVAGAIFWVARKFAPAAMRSRTEAIQRQLEEARRASEEAARRLADIESRLARLDTEITEIRTTAEAAGQQEEERLRAGAEEDRRKVVESAEHEIEAAASAARRELRRFAAELAVDLAEKRISVSSEADKALVGDFVRQIGDGKGNR